MHKKLAALLLCLFLGVQAVACTQRGGGMKYFEQDGALEASAVSKSQSIDMLASVDDFGRVMQPSGGNKDDQDRYVGLFYFLWSGQYGTDKVRDISKMLYDGDPDLWKNSDLQAFHHWGEPLFGYYNSKDPWVIRKHVELLTLAGVDFLVFDTTNNTVYYDVLDVLLPILQEYYDAGWDVPKFVFYTNSNSAEVIRALYYGNKSSTVADSSSTSVLNTEGIYKAGKYKDLWFCPNGKPMIIGITENNGGASDQTRWSSSSITGEENTVLKKETDGEILEFFEIKESQWPTTGVKNENGFPWIEFSAEATAYGETVNVSVAQHNKLPFSDALLSSVISEQMWGRGWHDGAPDHSNEAVYSGANFEERYETAIELDPKYLFITGWNEWVAQKQYGTGNSPNTTTDPDLPENRVFFVDTVNTEYSRDVEIMKGGYFDNFYLQMARNNRTYKGTARAESYSETVKIDIGKGLAQWNSVGAVYYDFENESGARDFAGHATDLHYTQDAASNDFTQARAASDGKNIYFLVETAKDVVADAVTGEYPQLYIRIPDRDGGYYGYHYCVKLKDGKAEIYSIADGKYELTLAGSGEFSIGGRYLQIEIPKSELGVAGDFCIWFKVAGGCDLSDPESLYTSGDTMPAGRMNFAFYGK